MDIKDIFNAANGGADDDSKIAVKPAPGTEGNDGDGNGGDGNNGDGDGDGSAATAAAAAAADADGGDGGDASDGDYDVEILSAMHDVISEKFGIEAGVDIKSPEDLLGYMDNVIKTLSAPVYSSDISMQFDSFVAAGGNPIEFLESLGVDNYIPPIDTQADKENIVRNLLKESGFSEQQISRKIDSYIEHDTLDQEAADALEIIKERSARNLTEKVAQRKAAEQAAEQSNKEFVTNVSRYIDEMKDVRGIPVTKEQRASLKQYLLTFDKQDGMTGYQRDFAKSVAPIVESAFFTQNMTALIKGAESKGGSDAVSKFKSALKTKNIPGKGSQSQQGGDSALDMLLKGFGQATGRVA